MSFYGRPACGQEHLFYFTKTVTFLSLDYCFIVSSRLSKRSLCVCSIIETQIFVTMQKCRVYHIILKRKQSNWIPCFLCIGSHILSEASLTQDWPMSRPKVHGLVSRTWGWYALWVRGVKGGLLRRWVTGRYDHRYWWWNPCLHCSHPPCYPQYILSWALAFSFLEYVAQKNLDIEMLSARHGTRVTAGM